MSNELRNDFTATGYIVTDDRKKMLLIYHKKLQKWLPPGGHLEKNELPHYCVLREVFEETGIKAEIIRFDPDINLFSDTDKQLPAPYCILHELIPASSKDEEHMHIDLIYILRADQQDTSLQLAEISEAKWLTLKEILEYEAFPAVKLIAQQVLK